jgi:hypothetical protein
MLQLTWQHRESHPIIQQAKLAREPLQTFPTLFSIINFPFFWRLQYLFVIQIRRNGPCGLPFWHSRRSGLESAAFISKNSGIYTIVACLTIAVDWIVLLTNCNAFCDGFRGTMAVLDGMTAFDMNCRRKTAFVDEFRMSGEILDRSIFQIQLDSIELNRDGIDWGWMEGGRGMEMEGLQLLSLNGWTNLF